MSAEKWLPVVGWEGLYEVSDQGRVRSLDRTVEMPCTRWGGTLKRLTRGRVLKTFQGRGKGRGWKGELGLSINAIELLSAQKLSKDTLHKIINHPEWLERNFGVFAARAGRYLRAQA
ncbi:MAG: NUMOD4 domain-containing protein [Steroidobacteraceae bacterium]